MAEANRLPLDHRASPRILHTASSVEGGWPALLQAFLPDARCQAFNVRCGSQFNLAELAVTQLAFLHRVTLRFCASLRGKSPMPIQSQQMCRFGQLSAHRGLPARDTKGVLPDAGDGLADLATSLRLAMLGTLDGLDGLVPSAPASVQQRFPEIWRLGRRRPSRVAWISGLVPSCGAGSHGTPYLKAGPCFQSFFFFWGGGAGYGLHCRVPRRAGLPEASYGCDLFDIRKPTRSVRQFSFPPC